MPNRSPYLIVDVEEEGSIDSVVHLASRIRLHVTQDLARVFAQKLASLDHILPHAHKHKKEKRKKR